MSFTEINHYVPQWYQRRFFDPEAKEEKYYYLDLAPDRVDHGDGAHHVRNALRRLGSASCFAESHLYTLFFGEYAADVVEKRFFGEIDQRGADAITFFSDYELNDRTESALNNLLRYLDAQKLRTPKGLAFLKRVAPGGTRQSALEAMGLLWQMHMTLWMEAVWEVLRCDNSDTKFIVSDHPVTTYNKGLFPGSAACQYPLDARIELLGTHTIFPLDLNRCLVLTNLGYVRNPWCNPIRPRENPRYFSQTMFDLRKVQRGRQISESDVRTVNFIIKKRAHRYIAAGKKEWLHPEEHLETRMWNKLGGRFFLMPDPRKVSFSTAIMAGFKDGSAWGVDEYGRPPRDDDPVIKAKRDVEWKAFHKWKKIWDDKFGELSVEEWREYM